MRKISPQTKLPPLDLLRGFEAAARHLSFTRAGTELFLTQSAVSRQIKALEDHLGVVLFQRRHRALLLTDEGQQLHRATRELMDRLGETLERLGRRGGPRMLTVSTTVSFASMWLVQRLTAFRERHPEIEVRIAAANEIIDMERERIDVVIRYCAPGAAPAGALRLFGEHMFPVMSPKLAKKKPLATPQDLAHQVLLHQDDPQSRWPWLSWRVWFETMKLPQVASAGNLHFSHYDQLIQAAIEGQGVALGRSPLMKAPLKQGKLIAPFGSRTLSSRAHFIAASKAAAARPEVKVFVDWVIEEARREKE